MWCRMDRGRGARSLSTRHVHRTGCWPVGGPPDQNKRAVMPRLTHPVHVSIHAAGHMGFLDQQMCHRRLGQARGRSRQNPPNPPPDQSGHTRRPPSLPEWQVQEKMASPHRRFDVGILGHPGRHRRDEHALSGASLEQRRRDPCPLDSQQHAPRCSSAAPPLRFVLRLWELAERHRD